MTGSRIVARADAELSYPPPAWLDDAVTPTERFFIRNHLSDVPVVSPADWSLAVGGLVRRGVALRHAELLALPASDVMAMLECAGNGNLRRGMTTAVGNAVWTGVPLSVVLQAAGPLGEADEVVIAGADGGDDPDQPSGPGRYERSIPLDKAMDPATVLAHRMNGEPLPVAHGGPVRLVVPGHYGMDSVKWVSRITLIPGPFDGFYQAHRYREQKLDNGLHTGRYIRDPRVKSLITHPASGARLPQAAVAIRGVAWAGRRAVAEVLVSTDGGSTYQPAELEPVLGRYAWRRWAFTWTPPRAGEHEIVARAVDDSGETQPLWPVAGRTYEANWVDRVRVEVSAQPTGAL